MLSGDYGGAFFHVGDQGAEARVTVERFKVRIFFDGQGVRGW
jgi:hypothetical protein